MPFGNTRGVGVPTGGRRVCRCPSQTAQGPFFALGRFRQQQGAGQPVEAGARRREGHRGQGTIARAASAPESVEGVPPPAERPACATAFPSVGQSLCITLGELLAQLPCCPQRGAISEFCPRWHDSGNRVRHTGFSATQVPARTGKNALVHKKCRALLLRLCIYKDFKKKTGNNILRRSTPFFFFFGRTGFRR